MYRSPAAASSSPATARWPTSCSTASTTSGSPRCRSSARSSRRRRCARALAAADARLDGIDQVVHTWLAPGVVSAPPLRRPHRRRVGRRLRAQPRGRVVAGARQRRSAAARARGHWCSSCRRSAWPAPPSSRCWPRSPKGIRVLAKGCGRQWGVDGATVNTIAAAPHHWVDAGGRRRADPRHLAVDARVRRARERGRRPRPADRAARRPRRALPHRRDARRRRRHLGGAVSARPPRPRCWRARRSSSPAPVAASAGASRSRARRTAPTW